MSVRPTVARVAVPRLADGTAGVRGRGVRTVRVALAGCGVVGGELVRLLAARETELRERYRVRFEVARVLVRGNDRPRPEGLAPELFTTDVAHFLDADAEVVVEAIGGTDPALRIARTALAAGRRFVTANKALVAAHGPALMREARRRRARFDFESAVGGGIPVLRALRDQLAGSDVQAVRGVLNGTTNFILTRLAEGTTFAEALVEAQARGYAEADPARDLSGDDAADKVRILAWLAFGADPAALRVRTRGIAAHADRLAADASALGGVPRLLGECVRHGDGVAAAVEPAIVAADSPLGQVRGADNVVVIESRWNGTLRLAGPGAGGAATASALLGDLVRGARLLPPPRPEAPRSPGALRHRWGISVRRDGGGVTEVQRVLERAGIAVSRVVTHGRVALAVTAPAPWAEVDLAVRLLQAGALVPVVARVEV